MKVLPLLAGDGQSCCYPPNKMRKIANFSFAAILMILFTPYITAAETYSDNPMETKVQTAPSNIMFILDNSGSMDWELIADPQGLFQGYQYLYSPGDNVYGGSVLSGSNKLKWQSQWSEYNKMYYNPQANYEPWPRWELLPNTAGTPGHQADLIAPRSNPVNSGTTQNIHVDYYSNLPITSDFIIVDDADGAPAFQKTGTWYYSSPKPEWNGNSRYTSSKNGAAIFTPNITVAGNYDIYAYWNCYNLRDRNALIEIDNDGDGLPDDDQRVNQRATFSNIPEAGVCGEWLPLFGGASYAFAVGQQGSVTISRDALADGASTAADAIAFVPQGNIISFATLDIKLAHYYMVNDLNGDGLPQDGEVYLVNLVWTDADGGADVDEGEVARDYYLVNYSGTNPYQVVQYAQVVNIADVPTAIIPTFKNEDGTTTVKTEIEDLQNFANWFSFYRRRELTAKAAVARTIADLEGIYVGFYTINSGLRQEVLPIAVAETNTIISDNKDNTYSESGKWKNSNNPHKWDNSTRYTKKIGAKARFTPYLSNTGTYQVQGWWNCYKKRDQKAKITIHHNSGDYVETYNQRANGNNVTTDADCTDASGTGCCGYWVDLGSFDFNQGSSGYVEIERTGSSTGKNTVADAIKFIGTGSTSVNRIDDLLNLLYGVNSSGGTPLRTALLNVGRYFDQDDGHDGNLGTAPFYAEDKGGGLSTNFCHCYV